MPDVINSRKKSGFFCYVCESEFLEPNKIPHPNNKIEKVNSCPKCGSTLVRRGKRNE